MKSNSGAIYVSDINLIFQMEYFFSSWENFVRIWWDFPNSNSNKLLSGRKLLVSDGDHYGELR